MKITVAVVAATAALTSVPAFADVVDRREHNQEMRIRQGVRSGQLTHEESRRLEAEQARIRSMEAHARRDGHLSPVERAHIARAQNAASRHIYREKHDDRSRWSRWWRWHR